MKVLVIGSGGREHAIVRQFHQSPSVTEVFAVPGNDGMNEEATCVALSPLDFSALVQLVKREKITFTFVGPEQPLSEGIVDYFEAEGLSIFGPTQAAAELEGSKAYAKDVMQRYGIPTAFYEVFDEVEPALVYIKKHGAPIVIKADGLAAGKGVVVAMTEAEAEEAVRSMLDGQRFGDASARIVIEEFLEGEEFSLLAFVHDGHIIPMPIAQDHKRAYDGDLGPNTGGMGAYCPVPHLPDGLAETALESIVSKTVQAMTEEGRPFTGILYAGLIATNEGPKVIEFNTRFGDPETQVVLPKLQNDFGRLIVDLLEGERPEVKWDNLSHVGVVVAAEGYPDEPVKGQLLPDLHKLSGVSVFHAGTVRDGDAESDRYRGSGGRLLVVSAAAESHEAASDLAYAALSSVDWPSCFYRKDIGWRARK
ncbi:phosphoribosylamine--glycine ligase [Chryseomicrobium palamuruense]|uniref:Phosphoribosylamine--glycine ligase n=1 Tax=Chryseomicrobium palamuruense TaxID=682973 RepID=A0ABV8UZ84_9BACL